LLPSGEAVIGTTGAYSLQMAVPGAVLPVAGITAVSVLPTHRRRGVLRSLMRRQLAGIAARGEEPVAALWASETPIYGRYGYGKATANAYFRFERGDGGLNPYTPDDPTVRLRLADPRAVTAELAKTYESVLPGQPGFFARSEDWWGRVLHDPPEERHGLGPLRCLLAEDAAGPRGYALYAGAERWDDPTGLPDGHLTVREVLGADPAAGAALWHNLLTRDLVTVVTAEYRSAEDPLLYQLLDPRRARAQVSDGLWVRVIDLPAALAGRAYSGPVDVVLEVTDELLTGNAGRWRLRAGDPGSSSVTCQRTDAPADLALDVRELGAAYLGGTRLGTLAAAGLVRELRPGRLGPLSAALTWDPAPWCPQLF
jgi:predicted acetyltransferase